MHIYLDTNVYRRISETREQRRLTRWIRQEEHVVAVSDQHLHEMLRIVDDRTRAEQVALLFEIGGPWRDRRLWSSAYWEAGEFLHEVARLRPLWLRIPPAANEIDRFLARHAEFWDLAARNLREARRLHATVYEPVAEPVTEIQTTNDKLQAEFVRTARRRRAELTYSLLVDSDEHRVSSNDQVGRWRQTTLAIWSDALFRPTEAMRDYYDYLAPHLRLERISARAFAAFFLKDVDPTRLPRNLIHGLMQQIQIERKVTRSNLADATHATHLVDVDLFLTSDARMYESMVAVQQYVSAGGRPVHVERMTPSVLVDLKAAVGAGA